MRCQNWYLAVYCQFRDSLQRKWCWDLMASFSFINSKGLIVCLPVNAANLLQTLRLPLFIDHVFSIKEVYTRDSYPANNLYCWKLLKTKFWRYPYLVTWRCRILKMLVLNYSSLVYPSTPTPLEASTYASLFIYLNYPLPPGNKTVTSCSKKGNGIQCSEIVSLTTYYKWIWWKLFKHLLSLQ